MCCNLFIFIFSSSTFMQSQKMVRAAYIIFLPLLMALSGASRSSVPEKFNPVTHGGLGGSTVTCEATYGFLPCTTEVWGQLFLIVLYEFLLSLGEQYVSAGSHLFFRMFGTGIFGASLFQILGSFPEVLMILGNSSSFPLLHLYFFLYSLYIKTTYMGYYHILFSS